MEKVALLYVPGLKWTDKFILILFTWIMFHLFPSEKKNTVELFCVPFPILKVTWWMVDVDSCMNFAGGGRIGTVAVVLLWLF